MRPATRRGIRRLSCGVALTLLLAWSPFAAAEYWISIGAFRGIEPAERLAEEASGSTGLTFIALPTQIDAGMLYRVATGPYRLRDQAKAGVAKVRAGGFEEGWIVVIASESAAAEPGALTDDYDELLEAGNALIRDLPDTTSIPGLPPIDVLLRDLPDVPPREIPTLPEEEPEEEEVVVPEDYRLNRLRRDGAARDSPRPAGLASAFATRLKWYTTAQSLPAADALRQGTGEATPIDHNADLRVMWQPGRDPFKLRVAYAVNWLHGDSLAASGSPGLTFDQTPTGDERRLMKLTWDLGDEGDGRRRLHRLDRLAVEYRNRQWGITAGRQAVSWGGGLVFQTLDLFNPFAPTTIDQDYKTGDDLILLERLFGNGAELQALVVGRRSWDGEVERDAASVATKFRAMAGDNEYELMASHHYGDTVYGVGLRIPAGGALIRSDITWTRTDERLLISGLVNADYTFSLGPAVVHVFGEYFHNGFGVNRLPDDLAQLPQRLVARIVRGELFNMMRNYLAAGSSFRWHYLLNQSIALIANLHDASYVVQASLTYDTSDSSRLQVGLTKPFGSPGDEFGGVAVGEDLTAGGGDRGFMRFVYFF